MNFMKYFIPMNVNWWSKSFNCTAKHITNSCTMRMCSDYCHMRNNYQHRHTFGTQMHQNTIVRTCTLFNYQQKSPIKVWLHDASNASNVGHLYDVTHHAAVVHMTNDKCQASNVGTGTHSAACRFSCPELKDAPNVGMQTVAAAECLLPMLGYLTIV